jgi:hypothetical protein
MQGEKAQNLDIIDIASPLGPDSNEAIDLTRQDIVPVLARRSTVY